MSRYEIGAPLAILQFHARLPTGHQFSHDVVVEQPYQSWTPCELVGYTKPDGNLILEMPDVSFYVCRGTEQIKERGKE